jgi:hypothetical protein
MFNIFVLPADNTNILNIINFKDIGIDTLQSSKAFKQIRASSRIYTNNLVTTVNPMMSRYLKLNDLYLTETDLVNSNSFNTRRQHTTLAAISTTPLNSTFLDQSSLSRFLDYTISYTQD